MPKLNTVTKAARDNASATKARRVRQPKKPPSAILLPTRENLAACDLGIIVPTEAEIAEYAPVADTSVNDTMPAHTNPPANPGTMLVVIPYVAPPQADQPAAAPAPVAEYTERQLARKAAKLAVSEFYHGASLPFKAAVDLRYRAPINFDRFTPGTIIGTERTASALAAILAYCTVNSDGTFIRGSGAVPRTMLGLPADPANPTLAAGIESGVLSRLIGTGAISYVSGPTSGIGAENAILRVNYNITRANMLAHNNKLTSGEHRYSRVLALLDNTVTHA